MLNPGAKMDENDAFDELPRCFQLITSGNMNKNSLSQSLCPLVLVINSQNSQQWLSWGILGRRPHVILELRRFSYLGSNTFQLCFEILNVRNAIELLLSMESTLCHDIREITESFLIFPLIIIIIFYAFYSLME